MVDRYGLQIGEQTMPNARLSSGVNRQVKVGQYRRAKVGHFVGKKSELFGRFLISFLDSVLLLLQTIAIISSLYDFAVMR